MNKIVFSDEMNPLAQGPAKSTSCVLLHESRPEVGGRGTGSILFSEPVATISCWDGDDTDAAFARIEAALADGLHVAGGFAYELGYHLEPKLLGLAPRDGDFLIQAAAFRRADRLSPEQAALVIQEKVAAEIVAPSGVGQISIDGGETGESYANKLKRVLQYIHAGDVYQINLTFPLAFPWSGGVWSLYQRLMEHQQVPFAAVLDLPGLQAASLSPELFFRKRGGCIESRPMKGTAHRAANVQADQRMADLLANDPKNRAENLMIVDLIRNDLGRLAEIGSVRVDDLFKIESYQTLHQMVSNVSARIDPHMALKTIFRAIFPCGSITGAPKIRAMEIIAELEGRPRGLYTGAIGYISPDRDMCFSVPIRTVELPSDRRATLGVGSGIVADSDPRAEWEECLLKARFLSLALTQ